MKIDKFFEAEKYFREKFDPNITIKHFDGYVLKTGDINFRIKVETPDDDIKTELFRNLS
jgi:hypothetical protein